MEKMIDMSLVNAVFRYINKLIELRYHLLNGRILNCPIKEINYGEFY